MTYAEKEAEVKAKRREEKMRLITEDWLQEKSGCPDQIERFRLEWPHGAEVNKENLLRAAELSLDLHWFAGCFLPKSLLDLYERQEAPLWTEYERQVAQLWTECERQEAPLWTDYQRQAAQLRAEYKRQRAPLWTDYQRQRALLIWQLLNGERREEKEA